MERLGVALYSERRIQLQTNFTAVSLWLILSDPQQSQIVFTLSMSASSSKHFQKLDVRAALALRTGRSCKVNFARLAEPGFTFRL